MLTAYVSLLLFRRMRHAIWAPQLVVHLAKMWFSSAVECLYLSYHSKWKLTSAFIVCLQWCAARALHSLLSFSCLVSNMNTLKCSYKDDWCALTEVVPNHIVLSPYAAQSRGMSRWFRLMFAFAFELGIRLCFHLGGGGAMLLLPDSFFLGFTSSGAMLMGDGPIPLEGRWRSRSGSECSGSLIAPG